MRYDIKDITLAKKGKQRIEWAGEQMPVLKIVKERFKKELPLRNIRIACCLHVTSETANLMLTLKQGGAEIALCASNPLSTQDDVAASLVGHFKIPVFAIRAEVRQKFYSHIDNVLLTAPHITMDDGADLVSTIHTRVTGKIKHKSSGNILGGTEETTTGVIRLRSLEKKGLLLYPIVAVNDAYTKHLFDNRYGTGQSTIDGIIRATNRLIAGTNFVVAGYGWCGRGVANRARGMGANVMITEVDPIRALEAVMDGFSVMPMAKACRIGDIFVTVSGDSNVITMPHFLLMKDGALVANSGHFDVEVDIKSLKEMSKKVQRRRDFVDEYCLANGKRINILGEGRLVNLVCAEGHPPGVMDMSFAGQALSCEYIVKNSSGLGKKVYNVPYNIDKEIARLKLKATGIEIDTLTKEQRHYLQSWELGT